MLRHTVLRALHARAVEKHTLSYFILRGVLYVIITKTWANHAAT
jgi:hypothetical protein